MKTTLIRIKNLFGIEEMELDGRSVELTGTNGTGKSSVLDAIRYALTNASGRDYIIRQGENQGTVFIEAGPSLRIERKKRTEQADYKSIKQDGREVPGAESFLKTIFTQMQLDPVAFTQMGKKEQNRLLLDLIQFDWDLTWIQEKFGELPQGIDYSQNILQVLNDIQSENGQYFQARQEINRDLRNKRAFIADIAKDIPEGYNPEEWEGCDIGAMYRQIESINANNAKVERAKTFLNSIDGKKRGIEADYQTKMAAEERRVATEKQHLQADIIRMQEQIKAAELHLSGLDGALSEKEKLFSAEKETQMAKLGSDMQTAQEYASVEPVDTIALQESINMAEEMRKHLREFARMKQMQEEEANLQARSADLTEKIELARKLPGEILQTATLPIEGLTVVDGVPLINGLPVSNLSEGEKLDLCVTVALSKPNALQIILIDGAEKLSDENRTKLYERCKAHGLQFIATRTDNSPELEVHYL